MLPLKLLASFRTMAQVFRSLQKIALNYLVTMRQRLAKRKSILHLVRHTQGTSAPQCLYT